MRYVSEIVTWWFRKGISKCEKWKLNTTKPNSSHEQWTKNKHIANETSNQIPIWMVLFSIIFCYELFRLKTGTRSTIHTAGEIAHLIIVNNWLMDSRTFSNCFLSVFSILFLYPIWPYAMGVHSLIFYSTTQMSSLFRHWQWERSAENDVELIMNIPLNWKGESSPKSFHQTNVCIINDWETNERIKCASRYQQSLMKTSDIQWMPDTKWLPY